MDKHFPEELLYTKDHEWCRIDGNVATIGITWHAQDQLGDIVYCELPEKDESISAGQPFGVVESVKAVSDLFSPLTGTILERNDDVTESPESLNDDVYDDGWLVKVELADASEVEGMLNKADYEALLEAEAE